MASYVIRRVLYRAVGTFREPDLLLVRAAADSRRGNRFWTGADLVVEIVSPDQLERDIVQKRRDYAGAEIPEYWIVDPQRRRGDGLELPCRQLYVEHGTFARGAQADSPLLPGLAIDIRALFRRRQRVARTAVALSPHTGAGARWWKLQFGTCNHSADGSRMGFHPRLRAGSGGSRTVGAETSGRGVAGTA